MEWTLETLPKDVLVLLALRMSPPDLMNFCLTKKRFNESVCNNRDFWVEKLKRDYPYAISLSERGLRLVNPKNTYIRNFTEIQKAVEEFIGEQKKTTKLTPEELKQFEKDLNIFITNIIKNTPLNERVSLDSLQGFLKNRGIKDDFFKTEILYGLERKENAKRDLLKQMK